MRRLLISVAAGLLLMLALVGSGGAAGPGCSDFGAVTADTAKANQPFGQLVSGVAATGPGAVSELVAYEHGLFCAPH